MTELWAHGACELTRLVRAREVSAREVRGICATVGGTLTDTQWQQYAGTSPPAVMPCAS